MTPEKPTAALDVLWCIVCDRPAIPPGLRWIEGRPHCAPCASGDDTEEAPPNPSPVAASSGDSNSDQAGLGVPDPSSAVLTMPLARLVDADGSTVTTIAEAVVTVGLVPEHVIAALDGSDDAVPVYATVTRRLTTAGAEMVRNLAALLDEPSGAGAGR